MRKTTTLILLTLFIGLVSAYPGVIAVDTQDAVTPFVFGVTADPSSFDPCGAYDTTSGNVILNTLETLYAFDYQEEGSKIVRPQLAAEFGTWDEANLVLTIPLRNDVTWWDGSQFTADDVVWNFNRLMHLSEAGICEHASLWINDDDDTVLDSVVATGTYEVQMTLTKLSSAFEKLLPFWGASLIKPIDDLDADDTISLDEMDQIIGTGPFQLSYYESGVTTTLVRYDGYYQGKADIEKIEFQRFADVGTLTDAMLGGEVTVIRSIDEASLDAATQNANVNVQLLRGACLYFYHANVNTLPWEVRKAAQFALNYTYYSTYYATRPGATSPVPVGMEGYNGDLAGLPYTDFELARSYLLESTYPEIVAGIAANNLDETSTDADWRAAAVSETPVYTANYTNYGGWYTFLNNYLQYVGIALDNNNVGDWPTFLSYMNDPENVAHSQFVMGGWCPDFFDPVNMLEPLFATTGSSNWNGLANETIDANLASLYTLPDGSEEKADMVDLCVTQIIVEQAAALYFMASADLIAWNKNPTTGIISGAECLLNVRGDKYFYPINFAPTKGAPYGEEFPEPTTSTGTVPGYNLGLFVIATLGASALLIFRKRK